MKNSRILLLLFALSPTLLALGQQYGWKDLSANIPIEAELTDVYFISDDEGWITTLYADPIILHTTDGGITFEQQQVPLDGDLLAIHMLDNMHGYCGISSGFIFMTEDGGANWNILASMGTLTDISFPPDANPDDPVGYACGDFGNVWEIKDTLTNLNTGLTGTFRGISSSSVNNVWITGVGRIYYFDGTGFTSQSSPAGTFNDIHFFNDDEGWVVGDAGVIGGTTNGGDTWIRQTVIDPQAKSLYGVFFYDSNLGWAVGNDGAILHTSDGGENWNTEAVGLTVEDLSGVHFTSPTNGYVVGNNKTLLKYTEVTGLEDEQGSTYGIELYPNPTTSQFKLITDNWRGSVKVLKVEVVDLFGHVLELNNNRTIEQLNNSAIEFDISNLPPGIYLLRIYLENQMIVKKIIKL